MSGVRKKPPTKVTTITRRRFKRDLVTQRDLKELSDLQAAEFVVSQSMQKLALTIFDRVESGAEIEGGDLTFDLELRMARTRREQRKDGSA